jgi:hypothetical protein
MALDLCQTAAQLKNLVPGLKRSRVAQDAALPQVRRALTGKPLAWEALRDRVEDRIAILDFPRPAQIVEDPGRVHSLPNTPDSYTVLATDGSQIELDRHAPVPCYVINTGEVRLSYGEHPSASLTSHPTVRSAGMLDEDDEGESDDESRASRERVRIELLRTVDEIRALRTIIEAEEVSLPTVALVDGSLVFWGARLAGKAGDSYVKDYVRELDALQVLAAGRPLALASYISSPGGREVTRAVRAAFCYGDRARCQSECWDKHNPGKPCAMAEPVFDGDLFGFLEPGQRSARFVIRQKVVPLDLSFFYLNAGPEIARVEIPAWVAADSNLLDLVHALVYDQCRRGFGYPVALIEAHELAVVSEADRQEFWQLVRLALAGESLPEAGSAKAFSKRSPWA